MAWFSLARELGMSVERAQREISSPEFAEWLAFFRITYRPEDIRTATICTVIARAHGNDKTTAKTFLPRIRQPAQKGNLGRGLGP